MKPRHSRVVLVLAGLLVLCGCVSMPTQGPVVESHQQASNDDVPGFSFDPRPPQSGQSASEIVSGFLEAMKAAPIKSTVAREFLTASAREAWVPEQRITTYSDLSAPSRGPRVSLVLTDVNVYDTRGAWQRTDAEQRLDFTLVREAGEWRIDEPPAGLVVPDSWFDDWYQRVSTYYFDPGLRILVPEPVHVPRGDQMASALVRSLMTPPAVGDEHVLRTFFPPEITPGLSVPIDSAGVAEVSLGGDPAIVDEATAQRMLAQLVWTLRQEPRIRAVELRIGERAIGTSTSGDPQISLETGREFDPNGTATTTDLFALSDGHLVRGVVGDFHESAGPFGTNDLGLDAISLNLSGSQVAGVTRDRTTLLTAPVDRSDSVAVQVLGGMVQLRPPAWDHLDRMWVLDRNRGSARVLLVVAGDVREVTVPGITRRAVTTLLVSRDGTRLVGLRRGPTSDHVVVARVEQSGSGEVVGVGESHVLSTADAGSARFRDLVWRSPTTVSVLSDITDDLSQVSTISVDGAPGEIATDGASRLRGRVRSLVSSPVPGTDVFAIGTDVIADLTRPERSLPDLPESFTSLTYAG